MRETMISIMDPFGKEEKKTLLQKGNLLLLFLLLLLTINFDFNLKIILKTKTRKNNQKRYIKSEKLYRKSQYFKWNSGVDIELRVFCETTKSGVIKVLSFI